MASAVVLGVQTVHAVMTRRRWIADEVSGSHAALLGSHADHLAHALRARIGQEFDIATADTVRRGRIVSITDGRVELELGAARIVPVVAQRTEAHLAAAALKRVERWQRIARQASEQSRRASLPEIL